MPALATPLGKGTFTVITPLRAFQLHVCYPLKLHDYSTTGCTTSSSDAFVDNYDWPVATAYKS